MRKKLFYPEEDKDLQAIPTERLVAEMDTREGNKSHVTKDNIRFSAVSDKQLQHHIALRKARTA